MKLRPKSYFLRICHVHVCVSSPCPYVHVVAKLHFIDKLSNNIQEHKIFVVLSPNILTIFCYFLLQLIPSAINLSKSELFTFTN